MISCVGCGRVVPRSPCERCRPSAAARGYGRGWQAIRAQHLTMEPHCRRCGSPATDVDHIVPRRFGGSDEHANLQSLCHACHSAKTARQGFEFGGAANRPPLV